VVEIVELAISHLNFHHLKMEYIQVQNVVVLVKGETYENYSTKK
jgi:hypothetical protein